MISIYCFSGSGHSLAVAKALSELLECKIYRISFESKISSADETALVVFPVYCQNIPKPVKCFLKSLSAKHIALIATYGKISYGNVLYEAQKLVCGEIIAGAYIPIGHTFLDGDCSFDSEFLLPIAERLKQPQTIRIPRSGKNPLADIFPDLRSRIGVQIIKDDRCINCGLCEKQCPTGAIRKGRINSSCIRCLSCVTNCPQKALKYKNNWILNNYLRNYFKEEYVLYI